MPVLPAALSKQADESDSKAFEAFDPGVYSGRLSKIEAKKAAATSNPMWALEFDQILDMDGDKKPGKLFTNLVLIDSVAWKIGQFFDAFGVPSNTNTDNLVGHRIRLEVGQRVATQGKREGQLVNEVGAFLEPKDGDQGLDALKKLRVQLAGKAAPATKPATKAAPAKAAAHASVEAENADEIEIPVEETSESEIDF